MDGKGTDFDNDFFSLTGVIRYHLGLCRAMLDEGLLPRVVTGTSAGALGETLIVTIGSHCLPR